MCNIDLLFTQHYTLKNGLHENEQSIFELNVKNMTTPFLSTKMILLRFFTNAK